MRNIKLLVTFVIIFFNYVHIAVAQKFKSYVASSSHDYSENSYKKKGNTTSIITSFSYSMVSIPPNLTKTQKLEKSEKLLLIVKDNFGKINYMKKTLENFYRNFCNCSELTANGNEFKDRRNEDFVSFIKDFRSESFTLSYPVLDKDKNEIKIYTFNIDYELSKENHNFNILLNYNYSNAIKFAINTFIATKKGARFPIYKTTRIIMWVDHKAPDQIQVKVAYSFFGNVDEVKVIEEHEKIVKGLSLLMNQMDLNQ